jgi:hypothetical protein
VVSDLRNLIQNPQNLGGEDFNYRFSVIEFTLGEPDEVGVPFTQPVQFDNRIHAWKFSAADLTFVEIMASGQSFDQNALIRPVLIVWDPDSGVILAETEDNQVDEDQSVSLRSLTPGDDDLWLILDPSQAFGPNTTTVSVTPGQADREAEPNNTVATAFPFPVPGELPGRIDVPQVQGNPPRLVPDVDFYVFAADGGDFLRFDLRGAEGGDFDAHLTIGTLGRFGNFETLARNLSRGEGITDAGTDFWVPSTGLYYVQVVDEANLTIGPDEDPYGGLQYEYVLSTVEAEPGPATTVLVPSTTGGTVPEPGRHAYYEFVSPAGGATRISVAPLGLTRPYVYAFDAGGGGLLGSSRGAAATVITPDETTIILQVGDQNGNGGEAYAFELTVDTQEIGNIDSLPFRGEGVLSEANEADLYTLRVPADTVVDIRVDSTGGGISLPVISILDARDLGEAILNTYSRSLLLRFDEERDVVVRVRDISNRGGPNFSYRISVTEVVPMVYEGLPVAVEGVFAESVTARYFTVPVEAAQRIVVQSSSEGSTTVQTAVYDANRLSLIRSSSESQFVFSRTAPTELLVVVSDSLNRGGEDYDFSVSLNLLEPIEAVLPFMAASNLPERGAKRFYQFSADRGTVMSARLALPEGSRMRPRMTLYNALTLRFVAQAYDTPFLETYTADGGIFLLEISDVLRGGGEGYDFALSLDALPPEDLTLPAMVDDMLDEPGVSKFYRVALSQGDLLSVSVVPDEGIPGDLEIGWFIASSFLRGVGQGGRLLLSPDRDGDYILAVRDPGMVGGGFRLDASTYDLDALTRSDEVEPNDNPDEAGTIDGPGQRVYGILTEADEDWYKVSLTAGQTLIALTTYGRTEINTDTLLALHGPAPFDLQEDPRQLLRDDDSGQGNFSSLGAYVVAEDGDYYLLVSPFGGNEGDYSLVVIIE